MKNLAQFFSGLLDKLSEYLAGRKGLLPLLGTALILVNFVLEIVFPGAYITRIDLFLHVGLILAIFGIVLGTAL
ncbi:hypothetical protein KQH61_05040 [bacterium]|nr:hypothetical protein [bacterium]MCB2179267.1 hypothetical protein [bacterium]